MAVTVGAGFGVDVAAGFVGAGGIVGFGVALAAGVLTGRVAVGGAVCVRVGSGVKLATGVGNGVLDGAAVALGNTASRAGSVTRACNVTVAAGVGVLIGGLITAAPVPSAQHNASPPPIQSNAVRKPPCFPPGLTCLAMPIVWSTPLRPFAPVHCQCYQSLAGGRYMSRAGCWPSQTPSTVHCSPAW